MSNVEKSKRQNKCEIFVSKFIVNYDIDKNNEIAIILIIKQG